MTQTIKKSYCHLCLAHCGINVTVDDDKIVKIISNFDDPVSQGYICEKAQKLIDYQYSPDRITQPLKKVNGKFIEISWDQALSEIANKIKNLQNRDRILYMAPATVEYKSVYKYELMRKLGAKFVTNVFSMEKIYPELVERTLLHTHVEPDRINSQLHLIIGQNPWVTQHYPRARKILLDIKNDPARQLIVIDPCDTETTEIADQHLKIFPGSDAWVLLAIIKTLIDNNYIDRQFIATRTKNFDKLQSYFKQVDLDKCLSLCGIAGDRILEIAEKIYRANGVSVTTGNGICHSPNPMANNYLVGLIFLLTGNYQKPGGMISIDSGISQGIVSEHYFTEKTVPWGTQIQIAGVTAASSVVDNLYIDEDRHFECVFIDNNNPIGRFPNSQKLIDQLRKVELVVILDSFKSISSESADYLLPTPTFFEGYEMSAVDSRSGRLAEPVIETQQPSVEDIYEILLDRLDLIDHELINKLLKKYRDDKFNFYGLLENHYIKKDPVVYYVLYRTIGPKYKHPMVSLLWWKIYIVFRQNKSIQESAEIADSSIHNMNSTGYMSVDITMNKDKGPIDLTGTFLLSSLKNLNSHLRDPHYQFVLQCGYRQKNSMNCMIPNLKNPILEISAVDSERLAITDGETIVLQTESAEIQIECNINKNLQSGLIRIANHAIINKLSNTKNKDYLNPQYKLVFANIRKL